MQFDRWKGRSSPNKSEIFGPESMALTAGDTCRAILIYAHLCELHLGLDEVCSKMNCKSLQAIVDILR